MAVTRCAQIYPSRLEDFQFCYVSHGKFVPLSVDEQVYASEPVNFTLINEA